MAELQQSDVVYQCVRGTDIKARYRVVAQNVPKYAEQTFYGTVLSRADLNHFQSHLELMWDGFDDPEVVTVHWIEPGAYDPEKAIMGLAPLYRAKAEPKLGEIIDLPEYPDCEWHTSAHIIVNLRMMGGVPSYTVWALAHSTETEVDHVRFSSSYKAMQFDPELLTDQRRRGWADRQLSQLGLEQRPDGSIVVSVIVERVDGKLHRFVIPGMAGRDDWGRSDEDMMRARGAVDEVLVLLGLAPAHYDENLRARLYGGVPQLMAVRQWIKGQILTQCQGALPRLKPDLPPQAWGLGASTGRGRGGGIGRGRGRGRRRRGDSSDEDEPEPDDSESDGEEYTASGRPKRKRKTKGKTRGDYVFEGDDEYFDDGEDEDERPRGAGGPGRGRGRGPPPGMGPGGPMGGPGGGFGMRPNLMPMGGMLAGRGMVMPGQVMGMGGLGPRPPFPGGPPGVGRPPGMMGGLPLMPGGLNLLAGGGFPGAGGMPGGPPPGVDAGNQLLQQQLLLQQNPALLQAIMSRQQGGGPPPMGPPGGAPMGPGGPH